MIAEASNRIFTYQHRLLEEVGSKELGSFFSTAHKVFQKYTEIKAASHQ